MAPFGFVFEGIGTGRVCEDVIWGGKNTCETESYLILNIYCMNTSIKSYIMYF